MSVDAEYVNTSVYSPLSGGTYINLPCELTKSMKDLINIKNPGNKCFLLFHIKHWNPKKKKKNTHHERKTKADKNMVNDLDYEGIEFPVSDKDFGNIEKKNNVCINVFCYENKLTYPVYVSD